MKTMSIVAALILFVGKTSAQKIKAAEVPAAVLSSFQQNFKNTKAKSWEKEKNGQYEAEFELNHREASATFNMEGVWLETETKIDLKQLPKACSEYIASNYAGFKISEANEIEAPSGTKTFEAELKKGKEEMDLIFDDKGNFLRKEK